MKIKLFLLGCGLTMGVATSGIAATTGTIAATLTLTAGCLVNGQPALTNANFGTLNFGSQVATFGALQAAVTGSQGAGIFVRCTAGEDYNLQITGSTNTAPTTVFGTAPATGARYLIRASDPTRGVAYGLYPSAASTTPIVNNTTVTPLGTADQTYGDNYTIFGKIAGGNSTLVPVGVYVDTINVAVNY
ncbi:spore coat protein U domain-containing protein [Erwinia sp. S38]|uniref:spore coat protein U domain-containing protein n=1 Tax=Erwinia sp. S38 TaxID=2769338 RepID=UPI001909A9D6|nr:spore coat protein U domain-containing protein [Erwinia sp. S38]MBK0002406.1 spore coat protein U domain-containing protein [Erwinia sp. S38]